MKNDELVLGKLALSTGLAHLDTGAFRLAANELLSVPSIIKDRFNEVCTAHDLIVYGSICALATLSRAELKAHMEDNTNFKMLLDCAPDWRAIILEVNSSQYARVFHKLEHMKSNMLLDLRLGSRWLELVGLLRDRCICDYFRSIVSPNLC